MAEHEVTEGMVEAAVAAFVKPSYFGDSLGGHLRIAIEAALAARTTDASAASGAVAWRWVDGSDGTTGDWCDVLRNPHPKEHGNDVRIEYAYTHPTGAGADADDDEHNDRYPHGHDYHRPNRDRAAFEAAWAKRPWHLNPIDDKEKAWGWWQAALASSPQQRAGDGG